MSRVLKATIVSISLSLALASAAHATGGGMGKSELKQQTYAKDKTNIFFGDATGKDNLRLKAMKEAAVSAGAQNGYLNRMNHLKNALEKGRDDLDSIYDFSVLMMLASEKDTELYFLPPVIQESNNVISVSDDSTKLRISGKLYQIHKPERLVTRAPNWRQYLIYDSPMEVSQTHSSLLPKTKKEQELRATWIDQGWEAGTAQAEREMIYRIRQLGKDFIGMTRYMVLLTEGKVTRGVVVKSTEEVTGGGNEMREDEQIIQLAAPASLNPNSSKWRAINTDTRDNLRMPIEVSDYKDPIFN